MKGQRDWDGKSLNGGWYEGAYPSWKPIIYLEWMETLDGITAHMETFEEFGDRLIV